ncbi:MAG: DUF6959 family protein [Phycisphaerales bacterium]
MTSAAIIHQEGSVAVVQLPGRHFPAMALQGDAFHSMADGLRHAIAAENPQECRAELLRLLGELDSVLRVYSETLGAHGMTLPW